MYENIGIKPDLMEVNIMNKNQTNRKKVVYSLSLVALLLISGVGVAADSPLENIPALIVIDESAEINAVVEAVKVLNGTVSHIFPPQVLIGSLSIDSEEHLMQNHGITVYRGPVEKEECESWSKLARAVATAWNNNYMGLSVDAGLNEPPVSPEPPPDDTEEIPDISSLIGDYKLPSGAGYLDTSEYLVGSVAVSVLFLESNGIIDEDMENWTEEEEAQVVSEIQNGLNWLLNQQSEAEITFVYEWHFSIPVGYEPISRPHTDDDLWEQQAMFSLGYTSNNYLVNEYTYVNDLRQKYDTDWAFLIYVVDDSEDEDNMFSDGYYAYTFLGGPRMVVTYSNSIWGIANVDSIVAHETCHIFWAQDQHCTSQVEQSAVSGYLAGENLNSEWNGESCTLTVPCIMKGEAMMNSQVDVSTRKQLGWYDADSDGILDVLDTKPEISFSVDQQTLSCTGTAKESPLENKNPLKQGNSISLNVVTAVQYKVDQGEWVDAEPVDGSFDELEEAFAFTLDLASGEHTLTVRARNSAENWSDPYTESVVVEETPVDSGEETIVDSGEETIVDSGEETPVDSGEETPVDSGEETIVDSGQACLSVEISVSPDTVNPGDTVQVAMTVHNTGEAPIYDVVPSLNVPDILEKVSGPQPESADIPSGETAIFEWVYTAASEGTLSISGNAAGVTEAGEGITSESVDSNTVEVDIEPELNSDLTALLYGVIEGNTIILNLEVNNTGETTLENVTPSDVTVTCTGTASVTYLLGPLPQPPVTMAPGTKKTFEWKYTATPGSQGGTAVFTALVSGEAEGAQITTDIVTATVGVESPAILTCFVIATPLKVAVGDIVTVAVTVQNLGQADAVDVVPSELSVSGTGKVKLETGPSRTSIKVEGRSFEIITWMYTAVQEGTVTFSGSAYGVDTATGNALTVQEKKSNSITITKPEPGDIPDDSEDSDTEDTEDTEDSDTEDTEPPTPPPTPPPDTPTPSNTQCSRAAETIQKVKNLLKEARALLEAKLKENRDARMCSKLLYEAELYLVQAEMHLKKGECDQASRKALTAMIKIYEVMNCLKNL